MAEEIVEQKNKRARCVKIALSGTHCSGKTTLTKTLEKKLAKKQFKVSCGWEVVRDCPFPVNEQGSGQAQIWIMLTQILTELQLEESAEVVILDRCVFDHLAYAKWLHERERLFPNELAFLESIAENWSKTHPYNIIATLDPLPLTPDGFRSVNTRYQKQIQAILSKIYVDFAKHKPRETLLVKTSLEKKEVTKLIAKILEVIARQKNLLQDPCKKTSGFNQRMNCSHG
jgi:predicted ATPase